VPTLLNPEQYLEIERKADYKSEYIDWVSSSSRFARDSGSHRPWRTWRVRVYTYPDIMVICGTAGEEKDIATNPRFIAEVLSDSTKN